MRKTGSKENMNMQRANIPSGDQVISDNHGELMDIVP